MWTDAFNGKQEIARCLDAQAFNGREKLLNDRYKLFFSVNFWEFCFLYTLLQILGVKIHTLFNKFLSQKWQPIWQEERVGSYEGRKRIIFRTLCHWIALFIE